MGNKVTLCHWAEGGHWNAIEVSTSALSGHDNHGIDIWPPIEEVTEGNNWPEGEAVYLNACVLAATPEPSDSPTSSGTASPSATLPETGPVGVLIMLISALILIGGGYYLWLLSRRL